MTMTKISFIEASRAAKILFEIYCNINELFCQNPVQQRRHLKVDLLPLTGTSLFTLSLLTLICSTQEENFHKYNLYS